MLDDSPESWYWAGYLMADGYIDFNTYRLSFVQGGQDKEQVKRFAKFIECPNVHLYKSHGCLSRSVAAQDKTIVPRIINKFGFTKRKTYCPCNLSWVDRTQDGLFVSFVVGFIDGDGNIRKQTKRSDCIISIKLYSSWKDNLQKIINRLSYIIKVNPNKVIINNQGYASVNITNSVIIKFLKTKVNEFKIPALKRKWGLVDESFVSKQELGQNRVKLVRKMLSQQCRRIDIAQTLNMSQSGVTLIIQRHGLKNNQMYYKHRTGLEHRQKALTMFNRNIKRKDIAQRLNVSYRYVASIIQNHYGRNACLITT